MIELTKKRADQNRELSRAKDVLSSHGWLSRRSPAFRDQILALCRLRHFEPKQALYHLGDVPSGLFGVFDGSVSVSVPSNTGTNYVALRADAGFWIGDLALFSEQTRLVTVVAASPVSALYVTRDDLRRIVDADPDYYSDFYALTYENMAIALRLMANLAASGSERRLGLVLLQRDDGQEADRAWLDFSRAELAEMTGLSEPTLQRALKSFTSRGLVEAGYGRLRVLDRSGLIDFCKE